jgi:hypothetical protein
VLAGKRELRKILAIGSRSANSPLIPPAQTAERCNRSARRDALLSRLWPFHAMSFILAIVHLRFYIRRQA